MTGGYTMIDCTGLNLLSETAQTIPGIHAECEAAIKIGKPVFAYGVVWGTGNPMTAIPIMVNHESTETETIVCTSSTLQLYIAENDSVTIVNMIPSAKTRK